ncbi:hypothetical protein FS749_004282 [Ceratobasidium sp. UAMH 11750]|nr:hypothetical protein FS749_004282 [Ceratobasidium sp. UAMH 11750]
MSEQRLNSDVHDEDNRSHVFHGPGGGDRPPDPAPPRYQQQQQRRHDRRQNNGRGNHHHNGRGNNHNNHYRGNGQHHHNYQHHRNRHGGGLMSLAHTIASANLVSTRTAANYVRPYGPPAPIAWRQEGYEVPDYGQHPVSLTGKRSWDADPESPERERSSGEPAGWTRSERWRSAKRARQEDARVDRPWPDYYEPYQRGRYQAARPPGPGGPIEREARWSGQPVNGGRCSTYPGEQRTTAPAGSGSQAGPSTVISQSLVVAQSSIGPQRAGRRDERGAGAPGDSATVVENGSVRADRRGTGDVDGGNAVPAAEGAAGILPRFHQQVYREPSPALTYRSGTEGPGAGDGLRLDPGDGLRSGVASPAMPGPGAEGSVLGLDLQGLSLGGDAPTNGDVDMQLSLPTDEEYQQALDSERTAQPGESVGGTS